MMQTMWALVLLTACSQAGTETDETDLSCVSESFWTEGNDGSEHMRPGGDCIGCHAELGEGPRFRMAGTVYSETDEADECNGREGIEVEITDSASTVWSATTNTAGNFSFTEADANPVFPITAVLRSGAAEVTTQTPHNEGNCASCHTAQGRNGAAGRIIAP